MTGQIVECVPNFSEGKNTAIIDKITAEISNTEGATLLGVDSGEDFNRTVVTIVGNPNSVLDAVVAASKKAIELIDMTKHTGEHARMGAVDVVPFIPIRGITIEECVKLSEEYAHRMSSSLGIPIYLYAQSARHEERKLLPNIRKGEYEGFEKKISSSEWKPDFGPSEFLPKSGVTATGARNFLIAYNVNLNTDDKSLANKIAGKIRTSGVLIKDENGNKVLDENGNAKRIPGKFSSLQAAGWMYNQDIAQVSMNLLNYNETGLHEVTDEIKNLAKDLGLEVTAGEIVGLVPLEAILDAGRHYNCGEDIDDILINKAINELKLNVLSDFIPNERIIELSAGL